VAFCYKALKIIIIIIIVIIMVARLRRRITDAEVREDSIWVTVNIFSE